MKKGYKQPRWQKRITSEAINKWHIERGEKTHYHPTHTFCIDCGKEIYEGSTRCNSCSVKETIKTHGLPKGCFSKDKPIFKRGHPVKGKKYPKMGRNKGCTPWNKGKGENKIQYRKYANHKISFEHPGCVWHHVNMMFMVACPEKIHKQCNHHVLGSSGIHAHFLEGVLG